MAGPLHAVHPSDSRKRRWRSRGSSASRSCSVSRNCTRPWTDLAGVSSLNPSRLAQPGSASLRSTPVSISPAASRDAASGESGIGSGARESTGDPNVTSESMPLPRRYAAVWYANMPPCE